MTPERVVFSSGTIVADARRRGADAETPAPQSYGASQNAGPSKVYTFDQLAITMSASSTEAV